MQSVGKRFVNDRFWRRSAVLIGLQILLTLLVLIVQNISRSQWTVILISQYVLTAESHQLQESFPNYYREIFYVAQFVRYGLPIFLVGGIIALGITRRERIRRWLSIWHEKDLHWPHWFLPLIVNFGILLLSYFCFRPIMNEGFEFQLLATRIFLTVAVLHTSVFMLANSLEIRKRMEEYMFWNELPFSLAGTRILFALFLIFTYLESYSNHAQNIGALKKVGLPYLGWLIELVPVNPQLYTHFCIAGMVCGLFIAVGFQTRLFLILNAIVVFYVIAAPNFFGKLSHSQLIIWISWILAFSPCYDVWSLDSKSKSFSPNLTNSNYGFHLKLIWLHFGLIYFFAGIHKLSVCGLDWALTDSMINQVQIEWFEHYDRIPVFRIDHWPVFLMVSGLAVIIFEICYPFLLFGKNTRWLSIIGGITMHQLLGKIMYIGFEQLQRSYLVFIPWNELLLKLKWTKPMQLQSIVANWKSLRVILPTVILILNFLFGVFNINSYPFSVYPIYAEIVPPTVKYFDYRVLDQGKQSIDFREEGRKQNFRWESYSRLEYYTIGKYQWRGKLDSNEVRTQWKRWQLNVPTLATIDSVDVYIVERPLSPERSNVRISNQYLMSIYE